MTVAEASLLFTNFNAFKQGFSSASAVERVQTIKSAFQMRARSFDGVVFLAGLRDIDAGALIRGAEAALEEDETNVAALRVQAWLANRQGKFSEAISVLKKLCEVSPDVLWDTKREVFRLLLITRNTDESVWEEWWSRSDRYYSGSISRLTYEMMRLTSCGDQARLSVVRAELLKLIDQELGAAFRQITPADTGGPQAYSMFFRFFEKIIEGKSIALVGNAGSLKERELGALIDDHDVVIRMNFPKLTGYEKNLGKRTDLVFFTDSYRGVIESLMTREDVYCDVPRIGFTPSKPIGLIYEGKFSSIPSMPSSFTSLISNLSYGRSTTGLAAIVFCAILMRKSVTLFGFNFFEPGKQNHFDENVPVFLGHEVAFERLFVRGVLNKNFDNLVEYRDQSDDSKQSQVL